VVCGGAVQVAPGTSMRTVVRRWLPAWQHMCARVLARHWSGVGYRLAHGQGEAALRKYGGVVCSRHDDVLPPVAQRSKATRWWGLCCSGGSGTLGEWMGEASRPFLPRPPSLLLFQSRR
jgi:hypothetical protein